MKNCRSCRPPAHENVRTLQDLAELGAWCMKKLNEPLHASMISELLFYFAQDAPVAQRFWDEELEMADFDGFAGKLLDFMAREGLILKDEEPRDAWYMNPQTRLCSPQAEIWKSGNWDGFDFEDAGLVLQAVSTGNDRLRYLHGIRRISARLFPDFSLHVDSSWQIRDMRVRLVSWKRDEVQHRMHHPVRTMSLDEFEEWSAALEQSMPEPEITGGFDNTGMFLRRERDDSDH